MKLLYKPFALIAGIVGARLGRSTFRTVWAQLVGGEPPKTTSEDASLGKVVGAKALEAATLAAAGAAADRASRRSFQHLFGVWPGGKKDKEEDE